MENDRLWYNGDAELVLPPVRPSGNLQSGESGGIFLLCASSGVESHMLRQFSHGLGDSGDEAESDFLSNRLPWRSHGLGGPFLLFVLPCIIKPAT